MWFAIAVINEIGPEDNQWLKQKVLKVTTLEDFSSLKFQFIDNLMDAYSWNSPIKWSSD